MRRRRTGRSSPIVTFGSKYGVAGESGAGGADGGTAGPAGFQPCGSLQALLRV